MKEDIRWRDNLEAAKQEPKEIRKTPLNVFPPP